MSSPSVRKTAWLLFGGLSACYMTLAPGTTQGRGYTNEHMLAGMRLLESFNAWIKGRPVPPLIWTNHGPVPLLMDLPFIRLGKFFISPDFVLSLQPILLTAALLTVLFLWLRRLCTPGMSLLLTFIGAFSTMLWPYAYIGLETKQAFFLLLAGYLALANGKMRKWSSVLGFAVVCGFALTSKTVGIVLGPAVAYLVYMQFRDDWRSRKAHALTVIAVSGSIWLAGTLGWNMFWGPKGGGSFFLGQWMIQSPFQFFTNLIGMFGSPAKGLFIFAPVLMLSIYAMPQAFRVRQEVAIFVALVTACTVAFLSTLIAPADELWGPRFMHVTVAPLLLCIGAAWPRFEWRKHVPMAVLAALGVMVSFLGAFFYYGARDWAAAQSAQNTLEWFAGDNVWNEVIFDARLFGVWWQGGTEPVPWTASHIWVWSPPPDAPVWKTINLRDYSNPQSVLVFFWKKQVEGDVLTILRISLACLFLGPLLLAWVVGRTVKDGEVAEFSLRSDARGQGLTPVTTDLDFSS
jgi:hypothetical protein